MCTLWTEFLWDGGWTGKICVIILYADNLLATHWYKLISSTNGQYTGTTEVLLSELVEVAMLHTNFLSSLSVPEKFITLANSQIYGQAFISFLSLWQIQAFSFTIDIVPDSCWAAWNQSISLHRGAKKTQYCNKHFICWNMTPISHWILITDFWSRLRPVPLMQFTILQWKCYISLSHSPPFLIKCVCFLIRAINELLKVL